MIELKVSGLTCEHCVRAVTSELTGTGSLAEVMIHLEPNGVSTIHATGDATDEEIAAAIDEAGDYKLEAINRDNLFPHGRHDENR